MSDAGTSRQRNAAATDSEAVPARVRDELRVHVLRLKRFYGPLAHPPSDAFALYVWEVLSSRTTPSRRDAAFAALRRIPALTPDSIKRAPRGRLEAAVALAGSLAEQRLEAIVRAAEHLRRFPDRRGQLRGSLLSARRALRELPQVGDGWAQRVLMRIVPQAISPRDAGVTRVVSRLGLLPQVDDFEAVLQSGRHPDVRVVRAAARVLSLTFSSPADALRDAFLHVSHHATVSCAAVDPHCAVCPLAGDCAYYARRRRNSSVSELR